MKRTSATAPRRPLHVLIVSNTEGGPILGGADRDWVNLLNALGPEDVRVTWVGNTGSAVLRNYLDPRVLTRTADLPHPCFYGFINENPPSRPSPWLWTKIVAASSLAVGRTWFDLRRVLRRDPVDIVITNTVVPVLGALYALVARRPHVWSVKEFVDPRRRGGRFYAWMITRCSAAVVVPSRVIGEPFASRLHVLPDGGDIDGIASRVTASRGDVLRSLDLPVGLPMVAQVGAISGRKGQHVSAEAFVRLADRGGPPICSLVFFGHGSSAEKARVERVLSEAPDGWRAVVRFDSFEGTDLSSLAAADIVVHPSTVHDAYPNAVREAMTLGKPVIASAMGGMVDMITDGESGVLTPPGDSVALASALEALVTDPVTRGRLGTNAAAFARQEFDVNDRKLAFLELFDQVVAS